MWLSKRVMADRDAEDPATLGTVSIGGKNPAVVTDAEKRQAKVISPGGYCWNPAATDCVLVVKQKLVIKVVETKTQNLIQKCSEMIAYQPIQRLIADRSIRTNGRSGFFIMRYFAIMRTSVPVPSRVRCWMRLRYPATGHSRRRMGSSPATQREECFPTRPTGGKTDGLHCSRTPADTSRSA